MSTPNDSPATRHSASTPAPIERRQDDIVAQDNDVRASLPSRDGSTPAANTATVYHPLSIFGSFTQSGESFHVFPHKGSAKLVASMVVSLAALQYSASKGLINQYFGGQIVDIQTANYINVDRESARHIPPLKESQRIIDAIWIDHSLEVEEAQDIEQHIIVPGKASQAMDMAGKPRVASEGASITVDAKVPVNATQTQSLAGRKRAGTQSTEQPVAKMKRVGTPKATQLSHTSTNEASVSVANQTTCSLSGLYQIASTKETSGQKASLKHYVDQVVKELGEWCEEGFNGTRTDFLIGKRKECNVSLNTVGISEYR